jgi:hypothetical protein
MPSHHVLTTDGFELQSGSAALSKRGLSVSASLRGQGPPRLQRLLVPEFKPGAEAIVNRDSFRKTGG